ncbi:hypothetical protein [Clostridium perfringens]|uniref:hypothetical protein n=1 Tax=Clostridium perfringens TaxID=1502 RepID=UPI0024BCCBF1|nr:hypothetical protein [Clostridium perfringens]
MKKEIGVWLICPNKFGSFTLVKNTIVKEPLIRNKPLDLPIYIPVMPDKIKENFNFKANKNIIAIHGEFFLNAAKSKITGACNPGFRAALNLKEGILEFYIKDRTLEGFWDNSRNGVSVKDKKQLDKSIFKDDIFKNNLEFFTNEYNKLYKKYSSCCTSFYFMKEVIFMPKRRSNTIANTTEGLIGGSGSNLSEGIIEDLVNAVNGRLYNVVTVQGLFRTRNRIEDINIVSLGNNRYEVSSTEGGTYIVDMNENSCECGQYVYRNECCRKSKI